MTHEDWLYLVEFHLRHKDPEAAELIVGAMKNAAEVDKRLTTHLQKAEQTIKEHGQTANHFKP